jgi:hypothetical protein
MAVHEPILNWYYFFAAKTIQTDPTKIRSNDGKISPRLTNAIEKPLDSSARKSLIYIGVTGVPSGLRPALGGLGRRENVQTESKTCRLLAEMVLSEVRKNPQEPA